MIKNRLFWRMFWAFLATLILTVTVLSMLMVVFVREERRTAQEDELALHTRDFALILQQRSPISLWLLDQSLLSSLDWKLSEIRQEYDADVWLVSGNWNVYQLGGTTYTTEHFNDPAVIEQLYKVLSGEEIRVQGLFPELGTEILTIGVPWTTTQGHVMGAVFLHVSVDVLSVDYSDMIRYAVIAAACALVIGTVLSYWISRRNSKPLQEIKRAVTDFAAGEMSRRVEVRGDDEMAQLATSFNQMAEDLSNLEDSRKSFVASVSHELRSPLTCIQGYVEGMIDGVITEDEKEKYLDVVLSETKRLSKLVNELLDLSRFESGNFPLNITRFDINSLLAVELLKFEQRIEEKHVTVEINFRDPQIFVRADADRIRQVATNLIDNAVKFLPDSGELTLSTHTVDRLCYVTIKDNGPGIAQDDLPFIYDRFYKSDKAHTSGMGTGLGLSIVKRILDQHGQTVRITSSGGTSVVFTLEIAEE